MKKSLFVFGVISVASVAAVAKTIDLDTQIKWNSGVVETALTKSGFIASSNANWDVRVTSERILAELLKRNTFSVRDATAVCLDKCNMSDFLKNGRGQSGKKCPELCTGFADALVDVNNEYQKTGKLVTRVYSPDKLFYVEEVGNQPASKYHNVCELIEPLVLECEGEPYEAEISAVVYESDTHAPIALLYDDGCPMYGFNRTYCVSDKYTAALPTGWTPYCNSTDSCGFTYDNEYDSSRTFLVSESIIKYKQGELKQVEKGQDLRYEKLVEKNGYCEEVELYAGTAWAEWVAEQKHPVCYRHVRKYAQSHACKLKSYGTFRYYTGFEDGYECFPNGEWDDDNGRYSPLMKELAYSSSDGYVISPALTPYSEYYEYTPSYQDCVATFNEQKCDSILNGNYID